MTISRDTTGRLTIMTNHHEYATPPPLSSSTDIQSDTANQSYRDHLQDPSLPAPGSTNSQRSQRGGVTVAFPEILHDMLGRIEDEGLGHVVSWQPHGRCFIVHRKKEFIENVMPRFFRQSKLTSFQRQLNLYGFLRLTAGRDRGAYYHELFLRGRPDLCRRMARTRVKGNGKRAPSNPKTEPDFYSMRMCPVQAHAAMHAPEVSDDCSTVGSVSSGTSSSYSYSEDSNKSHKIVETTTSPSSSTKGITVVTPSSSPRSPSFEVPSSATRTKAMALNPMPPMPELCLRQPASATFDDDTESCKDLFKGLEDCCTIGLQTGDEVFFEGLKFRYLDPLDFTNDESSSFDLFMVQ